MFKKAYTWTKKKLLWFFLGGVALAAGIEALPDPVVPDYPRDWARIENGEVKYVTHADKAWIDRAGGAEAGWKEVRTDNASTKDDADVGDTYRADLNAFIPPKPAGDATLDEVKAEWVIPTKVQTQAERDFFVASTTP